MVVYVYFKKDSHLAYKLNRICGVTHDTDSNTITFIDEVGSILTFDTTLFKSVIYQL